jgi:acetyl-CoA carboxylase biotin carboxyl carrier protein
MADHDGRVAEGLAGTPLEVLRLFREEASSLVKTIPGPMERLRLRVGDWELDVTWAQPGAVTPGGAERGQDPAQRVTPEDSAQLDDTVREIVAPIVGTFYVAPEPGAAPFVTPGTRVQAGQTVGIVEAMKLMNEVPAQWSGEILEVLVSDGEPVEFGQPLVRVGLGES